MANLDLWRTEQQRMRVVPGTVRVKFSADGLALVDTDLAGLCLLAEFNDGEVIRVDALYYGDPELDEAPVRRFYRLVAEEIPAPPWAADNPGSP